MDVMGLRRNIMKNEPHIATETGNPVSFSTDMRGLMGQVKAAFSPVQAGSGDPRPENVRSISGTNSLTVVHGDADLYDVSSVESGYLKSNGEIQSSSSYGVTDFMPVTPGEYYIAGYTKLQYSLTNNSYLCWYNSNKEVIGYENRGGLNIISKFQAPANAAYVRDTVRYSNQADYHFVQGDSYPITFPAMGANQWDEQLEPGAIDSYGNISTTGSLANRITTTFIPILPNTTYYFCAPSSANAGRVAFYDSDKIAVSVSTSRGLSSNQEFTTPSNAYYMRSTFGSSYGSTYNNDIAINYPASVTTYEPFTNTVYGGSLDLTTGVLTVTHKTITLTGNEGINWSVYQSTVYTTSFMEDTKTVTGIYGLCSAIKSYNGIILSSYLKKAYNDKGLQFYNLQSYWGIETITSESWNAKLQEMNTNGTPLQICYELATPFVYHLTPQQITALIGDNNIWSDANEDMTVKYWKH